jgi:hypothetical protein
VARRRPIQIGRHSVAKHILYKKSHTNDVTELLTDPNGNPLETYL